MTEQLTIARLGHRGDGVADTPAGPVYVPYTLPGETVTVEPVAGHPDRRHLDHVDKPSHERATPVCKHFTQCGGCAMQHWSLAEYHRWKRGLVAEALAQAGIVAPVADIVDAHGQGRRRAVLHARRGARDVLEVGFTAPRAHHIVAIDRCPILAPGLDGAIPTAWAIAEILKPADKPLDIQMTATDSGMDVDVRGSGPLNSSRTTALAGVAEKHKLARITRHGELVAQAAQPLMKIGRAQVPLPPGAFLQATAEAKRRWRGWCRPCRHGQARRRSVLRHRHVCLAIGRAGARDRRRQRGGRGQGARTRGCQYRWPQAGRGADARPVPPTFMAAELKGFDAVVFDPPRQGAEAQAHELVKSTVPVVVAVSCDATTFARDARILIDGGYKLVRRHAGRSVPLFVPRRNRGEVRALPPKPYLKS